MQRIRSIDFVRGLVMVIMALDHVREFMHVNSLTQSPTDLATTTPALFFTRWVTHICAPTFVFLAGASAAISGAKPLFLLKRGIWLIVLEFTVVTFGLWMDIRFRTLIFEVIGAIGAGFIGLAVLGRLPPKILGALGLLIIFGHNLFPPDVRMTTLPSERLFTLAYPPIPWFGIMLCGYAAKNLFTRQRLLLFLGVGALMLFILLRTINIYGDPNPWTKGLLSFLDVTKYPPSLEFTLVTLGISLLLLSIKIKKDNAVMVYGRVPLFYFIIHIYLIDLIMFGMVFLQGYHWKDLEFGVMKNGRPPNTGINLAGIYVVWVCVVLALYPLCKLYGRYKVKYKLRYL